MKDGPRKEEHNLVGDSARDTKPTSAFRQAAHGNLGTREHEKGGRTEYHKNLGVSEAADWHALAKGGDARVRSGQ